MGINKIKGALSAAELRRHAEERLNMKAQEVPPPRSDCSTERLLHELQVHHMELEIQNAELCQARDEAEVSLEKYTSLFDFAPVGFFTIDRNEAISAVNLAGACLIGGVRASLIGRQFGQFIDATDRQNFTDFLGRVLNSRIKLECELTLLRKGNKSIIVQIEAMATASGQEFRLALIDITGRKALEAQLLQTQKLESVGFLAEGVAHNFNNILNAIVSYASLSEMKSKEDPFLRDNLTQIIAEADRGVNLTRGLMNLSRNHPLNPLPIDINEIIRKAETILRIMIGGEIRLEITCTAKTLVVNADSDKLEQVVINLATNAWHAMPDGGRLSIFTEAVDIDSEFIRLHGFGDQGKYALITVADIGTGMNPETLRRIFEPFFTTSVIGKGAGLGLSIVHNIIIQHKGFIDVSSTPDKGTTFRIYLPLTDEEMPAASI
jgi:PAS domain S-box-containing protein